MGYFALDFGMVLLILLKRRCLGEQPELLTDLRSVRGRRMALNTMVYGWHIY